MKRLIYISTAVLLLVSCSNGPVEVLYPEPDYASVKLSSLSAVISEKGGEKTLFVATNRDDWDVVCKESWLDISIDGNSLTLIADPNTGKESRLAVVDIVAGEKPDVAKARFKVLQTGSSVVNLSAGATANSYIAATSSSFKIDASVKGNGSDDGYTFYTGTYGVDIENASFADLAWESTFDGDKTRSCSIIKGSPVYSPDEKAIYFTTGEYEGNAVLTICNPEGEILWSWHIWVTDSEIGTSSGKGLQWMDRNLGALTDSQDDIANRGMLYQWGRKDPFLPSPVAYMRVPSHSYDEDYNVTETEEEWNQIQSQIEQARTVLNVNNNQTGNGSLDWIYDGVAPVALEAPGNIDYSVKNPTMILGCRTDIPIGEYVFDWYLQQDLPGTGGSLMQSQSSLWGDSESGGKYKTIFDPCPPGYVVPPKDAFGKIEDGYACAYVDREWEKNDYGWTWKGGNGDFFPSTGNLDVSGLIGETSEKLLYWTSGTFGSGTAGFGKAATLFTAFDEIYYGIYPVMDENEAASWYSYGARCFAAPVRCVKE